MLQEATYPLDWVKQLFGQNRWMVTFTAQNSALNLGLDADNIFDCIMNHLAETHFYKTMPAEENPELMQDVYRITYQDRRIYLKLQVVGDWANVISFKEE
jgi:hypothetical protein